MNILNATKPQFHYTLVWLPLFLDKNKYDQEWFEFTYNGFRLLYLLLDNAHKSHEKFPKIHIELLLEIKDKVIGLKDQNKFLRMLFACHHLCISDRLGVDKIIGFAVSHHAKNANLDTSMSSESKLVLSSERFANFLFYILLVLL
jgi:hypothetical protein